MFSWSHSNSSKSTTNLISSELNPTTPHKLVLTVHRQTVTPSWTEVFRNKYEIGRSVIPRQLGKLHVSKKIMWYDWKLQNSYQMDFVGLFSQLCFLWKDFTMNTNTICYYYYFVLLNHTNSFNIICPCWHLLYLWAFFLHLSALTAGPQYVAEGPEGKTKRFLSFCHCAHILLALRVYQVLSGKQEIIQ